MNDPLRVVARNSALSIEQVREVFSFLPEINYRLTTVVSYGDRHREIPLTDSIASDFFTRELDESLLKGESDIAVHSAKDLPYPLPAGLELYALYAAQDKTDALVSRDGQTLSRLSAGATAGTSSAARKAALLELRPDLAAASIRGTIEDRIALVDSGQIDALVVATCALKRLGLEHRIAEILPFQTHALQGSLAVAGRKGEADLKALFAPFDVRSSYGRVTLAGFGPGNPDLLTIAGDRALSEADVIFHDDLIDRNFLNRYRAEKVCVGKRKGNHRFSQEEINEQLYRSAVSGKNTVRLKGGDPMIFGHGREEIDYLRSRLVEVDVIPGISAAIALSADTHIPLTHRGVSSSVAFATGHSPQNAPTPSADTLVYYMGGSSISGIAGRLIAAGRNPDTPAALVCNVSLPDRKIHYSSLKELQFSAIKYPTPILIVVGEVVAFESGAARQSVLATGTTVESCAGADSIVHTPLIRIEKANCPLPPLFRYDWVIFTSRYGVRCFFELMDDAKTDIRALANVKIASTGRTTTAELNRHHICPDVESATESAEGLIHHFRENGVSGKKILLPRSDKGLKTFPEELRLLGNQVTDVPVYSNTVNEEAVKTDLSQFRKIVFSSPSGVDAFMRLYGDIPPGIQLVAKGATTAKRLKLELDETLQAL
jgi:uroporphyrinogen III methyltransferase/synthase